MVQRKSPIFHGYYVSLTHLRFLQPGFFCLQSLAAMIVSLSNWLRYLHTTMSTIVLHFDCSKKRKVKLPTSNCQHLFPSAAGTSSAETISQRTKTISSASSSSDQTTWRNGGNFPHGGTTKRQQQLHRCDGNPEAIGCQLWKVRHFQFCEANDTWWVGLVGVGEVKVGMVFMVVITRCLEEVVLGVGFKYFQIFFFQPYLGKISILST